MNKYTVSTYSGEFRLKKDLDHDEMKKYTRANQNAGTDYSDRSEVFETKEEATARFEELKSSRLIREYPSNRLMNVSWLTTEEWTCDEDGELESTTDRWGDEYYPANKEDKEAVWQNEISVKLIAARKASGMTLEDLANRIGSSRQQIAKYESGEQGMTVIRILEVAEALDIDPVELLPESFQ